MDMKDRARGCLIEGRNVCGLEDNAAVRRTEVELYNLEVLEPWMAVVKLAAAMLAVVENKDSVLLEVAESS